MNYPQSTAILEQIKSASSVFITCHVSPDPDSVGSALSFQKALKAQNISSQIICCDTIPSTLHFLPGSNEIVQMDISTNKFPSDSLVCVLDIGDWQLLFGKKDIVPSFNYLRIDHHKTSQIEAKNAILDIHKSSTCEILFNIFEDWKVAISPEMATCLLTGIVGDTGSFQYDLTSATTHEVSAQLYQCGVDHDAIFLNLTRSSTFSSYMLLEKFLKNFKLEVDDKFVWTAVPFEEYHALDDPERLAFTDLMLQSVVNTNFGLRMLEKEKGKVTISFRSRYPKTIDISLLAKQFGGGGHVAAAGARVDRNFNEAVELVLDAARKFAKQL